jgi:hypothetical protein
VTQHMPPIRPGWLTRLANRFGFRRQELVAATIATIVGAPVAGTLVLLATVPVPQTSGVEFNPRPDVIAPASPAAEPTPSPRAPVAALTAPARAPRVIAPTIAARPSRTPTAPAPATTPSAPATTEPVPATTEAAPEPTRTSTVAPTTDAPADAEVRVVVR